MKDDCTWREKRVREDEKAKEKRADEWNGDDRKNIHIGGMHSVHDKSALIHLIFGLKFLKDTDAGIEKRGKKEEGIRTTN